MRKVLFAALAAVALVANTAQAEQCTNARVIMIGTSWCAVCKMARAFFQQNNIDYCEIDGEHSPDPKVGFLVHQAGGFPIFVIGGHAYNGYNEQGLRALLRSN